MTLTKEWLLKAIAELEEERDATPGAVNEDAAMALEAMKMALAWLETESVAPVSVPDGYRLQPISEYDAMCAAMLHGADGNSPAIPDGVCPCCGRKPLKNRTCSVSGCDGKHVARGFCIKHYAIERKKDPSRRESIRAADKRYRVRKAALPQQEVKL